MGLWSWDRSSIVTGGKSGAMYRCRMVGRFCGGKMNFSFLSFMFRILLQCCDSL